MVFDRARLRAAIKAKDGWWASKFSGPLANRLLEPLCEIQWITPNLITISSLLIGLIAAVFFLRGTHLDLFIGAVLVQLSFVVDCMDGQLARYRQQFSKLGAWLDRISDRVKDFLYFFSLALGFKFHHGEVFQYGWGDVNNFISLFVKDDFLLPVDLQIFLMRSIELPCWIVFPVAMIALFSVFLIDYYVNQDMKLEPKAQASSRRSDAAASAKANEGGESFFDLFLKFGLGIYESIPILRFNIGEQALLLSLFTACEAVFTGLCFFALLGSFYVFIWPFMRLKGLK